MVEDDIMVWRSPKQTESILSHFHLEVDGRPLPNDDKRDVLDITVENSLHLPDVFTIRLSDPDFRWIDRDVFRCGATVTIYAGYDTSRALRRICFGEVTAIEMDLNATITPSILIRGYDRSHRLQKGRMSRSFVQSKDSEIVRQIAREVGLPCGEVESSGTNREYIFQNNQTNWEFLQERARRIGFECFVADDGKLYFRKPKNGHSEVVPLEWGLNLRSYRPKVTTARQVGEVVVQGWDPKTKKQIVAKARKPHGVPKVGAKQGPDVAREEFGAPKMIVVDRPVHTQEEADKMAQALCEELAQDFLTAEGVVYGEPGLKAGKMVEIKNLGKKFSGKYYVTGATHTWTPDEGYMTSFVIGGKHPQTITDILGGGASGGDRSGGSVLNPAGGNIVVGIVTDNVDPEGMGRVKVKYPWLVSGHDSHWARLSTPMAGPGRGFYWIPEIDDEVLVAFEHGDMHRPYVIGCLWNGKDMPMERNDECVKGGKVNRRMIKTRYGHELEFNDTGGAEHIKLKTAGNHVLTVNDKPEQNVTLTTTYGHKLKMDDDAKAIFVTTPGGHSFSMEDTGQKIEVKTTTGHTITMNDAGNIISIVDNAGDRIDMVMGAISITALLAIALNAPLITLDAAVLFNAMAPVTNVMAGVKSRMTSRGTMLLDADEDMTVTCDATISTTAKTEINSAAKQIKAKAEADMDLAAKVIKLNS